jgi:hypothetical protein
MFRMRVRRIGSLQPANVMLADTCLEIPSIDALYYVDIRSKTRLERSELLDQVEAMIIKLEYCQRHYKTGSFGWLYIAKKLLAMRAKRFALVLSFHPKLNGCIHVGVRE